LQRIYLYCKMGRWSDSDDDDNRSHANKPRAKVDSHQWGVLYSDSDGDDPKPNNKPPQRDDSQRGVLNSDCDGDSRHKNKPPSRHSPEMNIIQRNQWSPCSTASTASYSSQNGKHKTHTNTDKNLKQKRRSRSSSRSRSKQKRQSRSHSRSTDRSRRRSRSPVRRKRKYSGDRHRPKIDTSVSTLGSLLRKNVSSSSLETSHPSYKKSSRSSSRGDRYSRSPSSTSRRRHSRSRSRSPSRRRSRSRSRSRSRHRSRDRSSSRHRSRDRSDHKTSRKKEKEKKERKRRRSMELPEGKLKELENKAKQFDPGFQVPGFHSKSVAEQSAHKLSMALKAAAKAEDVLRNPDAHRVVLPVPRLPQPVLVAQLQHPEHIDLLPFPKSGWDSD